MIKLLTENETQVVAGAGFNFGQEFKNLAGGAKDVAKKAPEVGAKIGQVVGQALGNAAGGAEDVIANVGEALSPDKKDDCPATPTICNLCNCDWYMIGHNDGRAPTKVDCPK